MKLFDTPLWNKYPFALPGLAAGALGMLSWLYSAFTLIEVSSVHSTLCHLAERVVQDDAFSEREAVRSASGKRNNHTL